MLQKLLTVLRTFLAHRTIASIAGEIQSKIDKLNAAETAILSHVGLKEDTVAAARQALIELEEKAKAEISTFLAKVEESKALRKKLS